jgi:pimeloyl-ACP methyl ester carboxylesterase
VMDVLGVKKPVLIGHSIAGEELSSIGSRFPDKVAGLIYLDAGYPYALYSPKSGDRELDAKDLKSVLNAFLTAQSGADEESMIASTANVLSEIRLVQKDLETFQRQFELLPPPPNSGTRPAVPFAPPAIIRGEQKYTNIQVPILAIFASPHSTAHLPKMPEDKKAEFIAFDQAQSAAQAKAFEKLKSAKVVILPNADHFVFFSNEQEVEKDIRDFSPNSTHRRTEHQRYARLRLNGGCPKSPSAVSGSPLLASWQRHDCVRAIRKRRPGHIVTNSVSMSALAPMQSRSFPEMRLSGLWCVETAAPGVWAYRTSDWTLGTKQRWPITS